MTDFIKFSFTAALWFFLAGFIYTGGLFFVYDHSSNAPAFLQGIVSGFEILILIFVLTGSLGVVFVVGRFIGRTIAEIAFRKLFS